MARKTQIPKEKILKSALALLIREGYAALNINTLANELGCSTQPLVWHFGNMEGLRKALADYALLYANEKMRPTAENAVKAFEQVGRAYIRLALIESRLFRFLYLDGYEGICASNFDMLVADDDNKKLIERISAFFGIAEARAAGYVKNTIIYTHGLAALAATGVIQSDEEQMMQLITRAADGFLLQEGVSAERILRHNLRECDSK